MGTAPSLQLILTRDSQKPLGTAPTSQGIRKYTFFPYDWWLVNKSQAMCVWRIRKKKTSITAFWDHNDERICLNFKSDIPTIFLTVRKKKSPRPFFFKPLFFSSHQHRLKIWSSYCFKVFKELMAHLLF